MSDQSRPLVGEQRVAAERLLVDYARHVDDREAQQWAALFAPDAVFAFAGREISGAEKLTKFAERSARGVHVQGVADFVAQPDGTVRSSSSFVFVNAETGKVIAGWYHDVLAPAGEGYVFARRDIDIRTAP